MCPDDVQPPRLLRVADADLGLASAAGDRTESWLVGWAVTRGDKRWGGLALTWRDLGWEVTEVGIVVLVLEAVA